MTGSPLAPIVIPIVAVISLAPLIFMVYHADSDLFSRGQATSPNQPRTGASAAAGQRPEPPPRQTTSTQQAEDPMTRKPHRMHEQKTPYAA